MHKRFWNQIFKLIFLTFFLPLGANVRLDHLDKYEKEMCLEILEAADLADLWNYFLSVQTDLYFDQEAELITNEKFWQAAKSVLELGSGNGDYLHKLSLRFEEKIYLGIEKQPQLVEQSNQKFGRWGLEFRLGDAELESEEYADLFDVVLFRLTLQHLKNPRLALKHAYKYLKYGGHVIIMDSYDPVRNSSHVISSLEEASQKHNERNKEDAKGNRRITMELLEELRKDSGNLNEIYEVAFTSLNEQGQVLKKVISFENECERKLYFTQTLLFLDILKKGWGVSVDLSKAYEELKVYLEDEKTWICPGMHYLILKKI